MAHLLCESCPGHNLCCRGGGGEGGGCSHCGGLQKALQALLSKMHVEVSMLKEVVHPGWGAGGECSGHMVNDGALGEAPNVAAWLRPA